MMLKSEQIAVVLNRKAFLASLRLKLEVLATSQLCGYKLHRRLATGDFIGHSGKGTVLRSIK